MSFCFKLFQKKHKKDERSNRVDIFPTITQESDVVWFLPCDIRLEGDTEIIEVVIFKSQDLENLVGISSLLVSQHRNAAK